jgi:hypothetical protein
MPYGIAPNYMKLLVLWELEEQQFKMVRHLMDSLSFKIVHGFQWRSLLPHVERKNALVNVFTHHAL